MCSWDGAFLLSKVLKDGVGLSVCSYQSGTHPSAPVTASAWTPAHTRCKQAQPQAMQAREFHGSAWNLKPGPHPGCRWKGVVTQKSVSLSRWKTPLHQGEDATGIQEKALDLETELTRGQSPKSYRGRAEKYFTAEHERNYLPSLLLSLPLSEKVLGSYKGVGVLPYTLE